MRAWTCAAVLAVVPACSLLTDFDPIDAGTPDAMATADAPAGADADLQLGPWQNVRLVPELNSASADLKISFTADNLVAFFDSDRDGDRDIYSASRPDEAAAFAMPTRMVELAVVGFDGHSAISDDGLRILFARNLGMGSNIYESTRSDRLTPFSPPMLVPGLASMATDDGPDLAANGATLVFASTRNGSRDLFYADFVGGAWQMRELIELNTLDDEFDPDISPDLLEIHFARTVAGVSEILRATRPAIGDAFSPAQIVTELGGGAGPRITADRRTIYFHRAGGLTGVDLYVADR